MEGAKRFWKVALPFVLHADTEQEAVERVDQWSRGLFYPYWVGSPQHPQSLGEVTPPKGKCGCDSCNTEDEDA